MAAPIGSPDERRERQDEPARLHRRGHSFKVAFDEQHEDRGVDPDEVRKRNGGKLTARKQPVDQVDDDGDRRQQHEGQVPRHRLPPPPS